MSSNATPALGVPAPITPSAPTPTHPQPEAIVNQAAINPGSILQLPPTQQNTSDVPPAPMAPSPIPTNNVPTKRKALHKPAYLDYDEGRFMDSLRGLIDDAGWAEHHEEVNKQMVRNHVLLNLKGYSFFYRSNGINRSRSVVWPSHRC